MTVTKKVKKSYQRKQRQFQITDNGRKNQRKIGKIRGDLSEDFVNDLLVRLAGKAKILGFHRTTKEEDSKDHTDFVVYLLSGRKAGIQVKSSGYGAAKFKAEDQARQAGRGYPVITFVPNQFAEKQTEEKRLMKELNGLESSLKKEDEICVNH